MNCHSDGGSAPFSLKNYRRVKGWAPMIREVIMTKRMPPWHVDPLYGSFEDDISLSHEETGMIFDWIAQGMPRGPGADPLKSFSTPDHSQWPLGTPDLVFYMDAEQVIPAEGPDEFRFISADRLVGQDFWIRAIDVLPGNRRSVHHCNLAVEYPDGTTDKILEASGKNMETGSVIAGYAPGSGPLVLGDGTGIFIPKGSKLIFRAHYVPSGREEKDQTRVGMYIYDGAPEYVHKVATATNRNIQIEPGQRDYELHAEHTFDKEVILTGLQPHMHYRGQFMRYTAVYPDGTEEILLSVPDYQFHWQRRYVFKTPKRIPAGTKIKVRAVYDNSVHNRNNPEVTEKVSYGPYSHSEMFTAIIFYSVKNNGEY